MKRPHANGGRTRAWTRATAALTLVVFFGSLVFAGRTYLWCVPMHRPMPHCCCRQILGAHPLARGHARPDAPAIERHLFEYRTLAAVSQPAAAGRDARVGPQAMPLPLVAQLPARIPSAGRVGRLPVAAARAQPRSGADPPRAQRARALLQIYRC